ncbi:helix-turn-helix domain-containing protein [Frankia sp. AgPm24]|nr:helix-turn-helix transcriptional regulator [Candidatus Frankia nodulisporulans]MCK9920504.1 helix-turn-helix domain-containing protein [Frankia sp. AgPm24]
MAYTGKVTSAESLGRILAQARLLSGLSQRELARRLGTTQKYIWELEAGKPSIVMDRLFAAMRATGMELAATITPPDDAATGNHADHRASDVPSSDQTGPGDG